VTTWSNKITGPNAGGRWQLPIRTPLAARVGQFCRSAESSVSICEKHCPISIMKTSFMILTFSVVLFGCGRSDSQLQKKVVGNWARDSYFDMRLFPDGSFVSRWTTTNHILTYQGTWKIQDGSMVSTITNCIAEGTTNFERVGSVDRYAIIRADSTDLVYSNNNQIISFRRK